MAKWAYRRACECEEPNEVEGPSEVGHVIGVIKRVFGFRRTRYRGLRKNLHRLEVMAALTNVLMQRRRLPAS
jgi:hypothetical protein